MSLKAQENTVISDVDSAAQALEAMLEKSEQPYENPDRPKKEEKPAAAEGDQPSDDEVEEPGDDEADEAAAAAPDEDEGEEDAGQQGDPSEKGRFVGMDGRVRLEDGSFISVKELVEARGQASEYSAVTQELESRAQKLNEARSDIQNQYNQLAHQTQQVAQYLQSVIPQPPDPNLARTDSIAYTQAKADYDMAMMQWHQANQVAQQHYSEMERQQEAQFVQSLEQGREKLLQSMPELKNPDTKRQVIQEVNEVLTAEGYSFEESDSILQDARAWGIIRDAHRYRALQKSKPKARRKGAEKPPVSSKTRPSHRVAAGRAHTNRMNHLRDTGSEEAAASVLLDILD